MSKPTLKQLAWLQRYNYLFAPHALSAVTETGRELAMVEAAQENCAHVIEPLVRAMHGGRSLIIDGDIGPATAAMMKMNRCGFPDYADPNIANAGNNSAWPESCRGSLTWAIRNVRLRNLDASDIQTMYEAAFGMWERHIDVGFSEITDWNSAQFQETSKNLGGSGVLANHYVGYGSCGANLVGNMNTQINWPTADGNAYPLTTLSHEIGHGLGLFHATGAGANTALMNAFINDASVSRRGEASEKDVGMMLDIGYNPADSPGPGRLISLVLKTSLGTTRIGPTGEVQES